MKVPDTWEELTTTAQKIQEAERRSGNPEIWGYVFQGRAYEGLTCNALEWIDSSGGGTFVDAQGRITINNTNAIQALDLASSWIGKISPKGVLNYMEEESRGVFQSGNAVFMRNWPYAWELSQSEGSPVKGKVGISPLPSGKSSGEHVGTLGGWSLAVSKFSKNKEAAVSLAVYLTQSNEQKKRALIGGLSPTLPALYKDEDLQKANPSFLKFFDIFNRAVPRPSRVMGSRYNRASAEIWDAVHRSLSGDGNAHQNLAELEKTLNRVSHEGQW
jgi:trehalose/maltose transport system substrate-binding protein